MIEVNRLTKVYGATAAVRDVTFRVEAGEVVGFLGPNGAGKTTTLRMLTGYVPPTSGSASIDGFDVFRQGNEVRARLGYLPENVPLYTDLRVDEFLRFRAAQKRVPRAHRAARVDAVVSQCGLSEVRRKVIGTLSRGFRQRVGLADALVADPPLLILDEPTSGFDPLQRIEVRDLIRQLASAGKTTILFSSHILSEVQAVSQRLLVIARGAIVANGKSDDLLRRFGENRYHVEVASAKGDVEALLRAVPGLVSVERQNVADAAMRFEVVAAPGADPREAIFDACTSHGVRLRELASDQPPLEVVFARLVSGQELASSGSGAAAAEPAGALA